jgi:hypothetical protein
MFPRALKRPGCEVDHSPSSVEVKNGGCIPPLPHTSSWRGAKLIKHRDDFTFFNLLMMKLRIMEVPQKKINSK